MRAFISSEMETGADATRRGTAIQVIRELGHEPVFFEGKAARPLPKGMDALDYCRELVRESDVVLCIVDDAVTAAMEAELEEAHEKLGTDCVFYYFTKTKSRDARARGLWDGIKESNLLATFSTDAELSSAVRKSIASFIDDALKLVRKPGPRVILETSQIVEVGVMRWWNFDFEAGDRLSIDIHGNGKFYAEFLTSAQFAKLHSGKADYGMAFGNDVTAHHFQHEVEEDGTYYLAIKRGLWNDKPVIVNVRWVSR